jgi:hypothetical protein
MERPWFKVGPASWRQTLHRIIITAAVIAADAM